MKKQTLKSVVVYYLLFGCASLCIFNISSPRLMAAETKNDQYQVPVHEIRTFAPTKIPKTGINWKMEERLRHSDNSPLNFADKYTLLEIGCGTGCIEFCLIDRTTGEVSPGKSFNQDFPKNYDGPTGLKYRRDSKLLTVYHATANKFPVTTDYYVWNGNSFTLSEGKTIQDKAKTDITPKTQAGSSESEKPKVSQKPPPAKP